MANTGYLIQPKLKKVTDDLNEYPLDINNNLVSVTGLPQDTMDNPEGSDTYRILNTTACPVPEPPDDDLFLSLGGNIVGSNVTVDVEIKDVSNILTSVGVNVTVQVQLQFTEISTGDPVTVVPFATIPAGSTSVYVYDYDTTAFTFIDSFIMSATPNPADGHNLIF